MTDSQFFTALATALVWMIHLAFVARAILRPHRDPASRVAWVVVILVVPVLGSVAYLLLGETSIGRHRVANLRTVMAQLPQAEELPDASGGEPAADIPENYRHLFTLGRSVNGYAPVGGNQARLMVYSNSTIDSMVADIDAAKEHAHLCFYIWLPDKNGLKIAAALQRAAARGVACRALADGLGSRTMIASSHWRALRDSGVQVATALPIGSFLLRALRGRIDLRNHRKIVVIDHRITYCGSQNCADPEFLVKAKYAPWVDAMVRFEGQIARQNQHLFASDWMGAGGDDISGLLRQSLPSCEPGMTAQVIGTGPTVRYSAMPETFETLMHAARGELIITTPYYVPVESMQAALCACAQRGVATTIIFPARNDSRIVAAASQSYYADLLAAGVRIFEFEPGLLHTKSLTLDGEITLIGSANMDRRSFELNYENNILVYDPDLTAQVRQRQHEYLAQARPVTTEDVNAWPMRRRLWNNAIAMLGPVL